ncbi:MAG: response regulator [Candidatus Izemoplasmatales bacterium]|nr:response regulator [Candidatus Izemoplasmatales bacterium]
MSIQSRIEIVKEIIRSKLDFFIFDQFTNTYNELFLKEYLTYEISQTKIDSNLTNTIYVLYFYIDNLMEINAKFNPEFGDETILNLGYLLRQYKKESDILIKRNGPGFILYCNAARNFKISDYASFIQNNIKKSEIFIEPISVSVALVSLDEFNMDETDTKICEKMLSTGTKRINIVPSLGPNAYLDKDIPMRLATIGKILIVEDDLLTQKVLFSFFNNNGVEVVIAPDGTKGLEIAKNREFDAIIVEKTIPKMDGFALKNALNDSTSTMNTLYIILVQRKSVEVIRRGNELRVDYIVEKPIIFEEILGFIQREIKKRGYQL